MTAPERLILRDPETAHQPNATLDFTGLLLILRRQAKIAAFVIVAVMGAAALYLESVNERYVARATLVLTPIETRVDHTASQLESYDVSHSIVETELDVLRSRDFAANVAERLLLAREPSFAPSSDAPPMSDAMRRAQIIDKLRASYSVFRSGESLAIEIKAETEDPELTAAIANGVAETYIDRAELDQRQEIERSIALLETRVEKMSANLSAMEMELVNFLRVNSLDDTDILDRLLGQRIRTMNILDTLERDARQSDVERNRAVLADIEDRLREHTSASLTLDRMQRALELEQTRYQAATTRLNELETQLDFVPPRARHVSVAQVPVEAAWPNTKVALALCFLAASILAFVTALLFEALNRRVWTETDVYRLTGLRNVGSVPRIPRSGFLWRRPPPLKFLSTDPRSVFNEGLRGVLTLWMNAARSSRSTVLMVTSSLPNEGKSTVALSLAGSAARDGLRVLVVDLDVHQDGVTALAREKHTAASLEAMAKYPDTPQKWYPSDHRTASRSTSVDDFEIGPKTLAHGLELISVGAQGRLNPNVLEDVRDKLIPELRKHYDLILLDTPPVLVLNDACRFGRMADTVLIVVRWGQTKCDNLRETHDRLKRNGSVMFGTILNDVDPRKQYQDKTGAYLGGSAYTRHTFGKV